MTSFVMNQAQLDMLGVIAEDLGRNAQALVDLVAGIRDNQVDDAARQAANDANAAIAAANDVRRRAAAGTATAEEVADVEHQLDAAGQSVATQLQSLRDEVDAHSTHLSRIDELLGVRDGRSARLDTLEAAQERLAHAVGDGDDDNPGLARRVTAVEEQVADLHRNGVGGDGFNTGMAILVMFVMLILCWFFGWLTFGWVLGIGIGAVMGAVLGFAAGHFFRHHN